MKTVVKEAIRDGIIDENTPSLSYLRRVVMGQIKDPNPHKLEAAKALLAYEAPRWGERDPDRKPLSEEESEAAMLELMRRGEVMMQLFRLALAPDLIDKARAAALECGYTLERSQSAAVIPLPKTAG